MLVNPPAKRNFLPILSASGASQLELRYISLNGDNLGASGRRPNVDHENLVLGELSHFGLLSICSLDTEEATKEEIVDFKIRENAGQTTL
jgi:hypothetical protein